MESRSVRSSIVILRESACAMQLELLRLSLSLLLLTTLSCTGAVSAEPPDSAGESLNVYFLCHMSIFFLFIKFYKCTNFFYGRDIK